MGFRDWVKNKLGGVPQKSTAGEPLATGEVGRGKTESGTRLTYAVAASAADVNIVTHLRTTAAQSQICRHAAQHSNADGQRPARSVAPH